MNPVRARAPRPWVAAIVLYALVALTIIALVWWAFIWTFTPMLIADQNITTWLNHLDEKQKVGIVGVSEASLRLATIPLIVTNVLWAIAFCWKASQAAKAGAANICQPQSPASQDQPSADGPA